MSTEETVNIEKNLGKLQKRMEEEKMRSDFQARVMEMARKVQNGKRFMTLIKNLANPRLDFGNFLNELWIGYTLIDYNPEYESKCDGSSIDFKIVTDNQTVWIEVKSKQRSNLEKIIDERIKEVKPSWIKILARKVPKKYVCCLNFDQDIPKKIVEELLRGVPARIEEIAPIDIYEGSEVTLKKGIFLGCNYAITLQFSIKFEKWDITYGGGGIDGSTFALLKDMIVGKTDKEGVIIRKDKNFEFSLLYKFDKRNNNDITIGIIDPTPREIDIGSAKKSFHFQSAKAALENIIIGKRWANDPNRTTFPWYDEVKKKIDAIFLVCANPIRTSKSLEIEKFISSLSNENKIPVIEKIFNKICATQLPS